MASEAHARNARRPAACGIALGMALARIDLRVCELKVLAAQTAVSWGRPREPERLMRELWRAP